MLKLEHITWSTPDGVKILDDVSLEVPDKKLIAITGPNGGGKTTLAKVMAGILKPDSGRVLLDGQDITKLDVTERAHKGIAFAFQQPVRFKGLTVRTLIEIAAGGEVSYTSLCEHMSAVGLCARDYLDREVNSTLSGGEMKRIEIATVLARKARLSIFDEPEAGIDIWSFAGLIKTFDALRQRPEGTLVIVSHQERLLRIADEIIVLAGGKLTRRGAGEEMLMSLISSGDAGTVCEKKEAMIGG
ncbi:MAG: ATP-binding cassette domain-containing protein [Clostridia bacterium]|nr:ATP-binding cassette domain-containing protein [Clostridia bacterium]